MRPCAAICFLIQLIKSVTKIRGTLQSEIAGLTQRARSWPGKKLLSLFQAVLEAPEVLLEFVPVRT